MFTKSRNLLVPTFGMLLVLALGGCASAAGDRSATTTTDPNMPRLNGHNGVIASGVDAPGFVNTSLKDWTTDKSDFVAVATVKSEDLLPSQTNEPDPEARSSIQTITIDKVLWRNPNGLAAPSGLHMVSWGFSRNNDTGVVGPIVPSDGPRLQPGDRFVGSFSNDVHRFGLEYTKSADYQRVPAHWGIFTDKGALKIVDGKIVTNERTTDYEKPLAGLTVEAFTAKLLDAAKQP